MKVLWCFAFVVVFGDLADGFERPQKMSSILLPPKSQRLKRSEKCPPGLNPATRSNFLILGAKADIGLLKDTIDKKAWRMMTKILLSVYYESQCPDTKSFVLQQLRPALRLLHEHIELQLVPFGKSTSINYGDDGFKCQHGPAECLGNMVQNCALYQMRLQSNLDQLAYVACEMESEAGSRGSLDCVRKAGLRTEQVEKCLRTRQGKDLQLNSEYLTLLLKPKFIPTIAINALFNQHVQDNALVDLTGTLCAEPALENTVACAQYYNSLAMRHLFSYPLDDEPENIPLYKYQTYFYIH